MTQFDIRSAIPGRVRIRHPELKGLAIEDAQGLAFFIEAIPGVNHCTINPRLGSMLLVYEPEETSLEALCAMIPSEEMSVPSVDDVKAMHDNRSRAQKLYLGGTRLLGSGLEMATGGASPVPRDVRLMNRMAFVALASTLLTAATGTWKAHVIAGAVMSLFVGTHLYQRRNYL